MTAPTSRRRFLKAGLFGALALATAGGLYRTFRAAPVPSPFLLDAQGISALRAIAAAMLQGALPANTAAGLDSAVAGTQAAIAGLPLATQKEIQDLFGLLVLGPTRRFLVGLPDDWAEAKPADVAAFLQNWRLHRIQMLQGAYAALHDLILGAWYADPQNWAAIGYPGPHKVLSQGQSA